jgi:hypothetical protein
LEKICKPYLFLPSGLNKPSIYLDAAPQRITFDNSLPSPFLAQNPMRISAAHVNRGLLYFGSKIGSISMQNRFFQKMYLHVK